MKIHLFMLAVTLTLSAAAHADNSTLDAALGGGIGAAIGNEIGGRDGAILGGAIGAAVGTVDSHGKEHTTVAPEGIVRYEIKSKTDGHPHDYHCPPGQAKKGRC